jgi:hypothetical protein
MAMLSPACADSSNSASGSQILNGQVQLNSAISTLNTTIDHTGGDVGVQSVAAGNVVDITTMNDTTVESSQYTNAAQVTSTANATIANVAGSVGVVNQAVCNSASVSTDPSLTAVNNYQQCAAQDPTATSNISLANINGSVSIANSAIANNFEADSNAGNMPIINKQINTSTTVSSTTAAVSNVAGTVSVTSSAVGNNAQIVHYSTTP